MREKASKPAKKKARGHNGLIGFVGIALVVLAFAGLSAFGGDALWDRILPPLTPAPTLARQTQAPDPAQTPLPVKTAPPAAEDGLVPVSLTMQEMTVWIPQSGSRYHLTATCSGMQNPTAVSLQEAKHQGFSPCQRCNPPE